MDLSFVATIGPLLADTAEAAGGNTNVPLLVGGGLLAVAGIALLATRTGPPVVRWGALALGIVVAAGGLVLPRLGGSERPDAHVSILRPAEGAQVEAGEPVEVEVEIENGRIARSHDDTEGGHLHLYVDDKLLQMPYSQTAEVELEPGEHELRVEFVDYRHVSYDPPIDETITVTAS